MVWAAGVFGRSCGRHVVPSDGWEGGTFLKTALVFGPVTRQTHPRTASLAHCKNGTATASAFFVALFFFPTVAASASLQKHAGVRASRIGCGDPAFDPSIQFATAPRPVAAARPADGFLGLSNPLRRGPLQKGAANSSCGFRHRPPGEFRRKRPGRQRRAGEARPAGSRAWIDRPRNTRGGWNYSTRLRASERHTGTCGGSPALLCAAAAR